MPNLDLLPTLLSKIYENQLALGADTIDSAAKSGANVTDAEMPFSISNY